jgi:capsule polysaccharide export protein KpsE/RkpR
MNFQSVVEDVKGRVETISGHGQKVAEISIDSLKQVGDVVVGGYKSLVTENTTAAKEIYSAAVSSFEKAKTDGLKAIAADPISYLPATDTLVAPFNQTVTVVSRTGEELYKVVKTGVETIQAQLTGKSPAAKVAKAAKSTTKKAAATVKKAVKAAQ